VIAEILATLAAAVFFGAAVYINLVEQPARLSLGSQLAVAEWRPSYKRGTRLQVPLALSGSFSAVVAWWMNGDRGWMLGGLLFFAVIPFTLLFVLPTNRRLESEALDLASDEAVRLLRRWGHLHAVRSLLSGLALVVFLLTLSGNCKGGPTRSRLQRQFTGIDDGRFAARGPLDPAD
jgi:Anthrone oxygenase